MIGNKYDQRLSVELDPLSVASNKTLGATYFRAGQLDQAIEQYRKAVEIDPNYAEVHDLLSDAYARKQMFNEAAAEEKKYLQLAGDEDGASSFEQDFEQQGYRKAKEHELQQNLEDLLEASKQQYVSPVAVAIQYAELNQIDEAFVWLEKAYAEKSPWLAYMKTDPQFENLRSDPRFADLLRRMKIPD